MPSLEEHSLHTIGSTRRTQLLGGDKGQLVSGRYTQQHRRPSILKCFLCASQKGLLEVPRSLKAPLTGAHIVMLLHSELLPVSLDSKSKVNIREPGCISILRQARASTRRSCKACCFQANSQNHLQSDTSVGCCTHGQQVEQTCLATMGPAHHELQFLKIVFYQKLVTKDRVL